MKGWQTIAAEMRIAQVRRLRFSDGTELELEPAPATIPAPPDYEAIDPEPPEDKPEGVCARLGCQNAGGFAYAPSLCEHHGLAAFGVK